MLLDAFTILTCAHVIGKEGRPAVAHPRLADRVPADVRWSDDHLDLALLISERPCLQRQPAAALPEIRLGEVATAGPLPHCEILGFPRIQRYGDDGALDLDQYPATVLPTAGSVRGALVCTLDQPAAAERPDGTSPLRGLSGAPVFAGEVLLGIVTEVPRGRGHLRLEGAPVPETAIRRFTRLSARFERVTDRHPQDHLFEERYARALKARYQKTRIFGIDELSTGEATWDLDTAYLSLEADQQNRETRGPFDAHAHSSQPRRIHDLLADRPRAVLRGEAGAGKTTLVWWLASHAVCGTLSPELAELNGLVPFVVPLRTVQARGSGLPTPGRLPAVAGLLTDDAPPGWAVRVLESGRALLLVDGVDEVPASERDNTRTWLTELLNLYPRTRCLATVRPLAKFVTAWHTAARIECDAYTDRERAASEQAHLEHLEGELRAQFERNTALRTLARTPLLCAVICALHRRRGGLLPDTRWDLYRATLAMLLGSRDAQRNIGVPEGITMGFDEHQELLQAVAVWLVRGGQSQLSHEDAERQIEGAMRRLPHVKAQGPASAVLTYLLNRSGLLQERVGDVVQFIHRTFQDYLAARALVEGGSLPELLRNAHNEQWHDTILLAVGHCRPNEVKTLIEGLIEAGDATADPTVRESVHVLAARCFLDAVVVDETVEERIAARVRALLPPRPGSDPDTLGSLGSYLLPLLPDPSGLTEEESNRTARLISLIGGAEAIPAAARYARHGGRAARAHLCANWHRFPAEEYAREVLSAMPLATEALFVSRPEHLRELSTLPPIGFLGVLNDVTSEDLLSCLRDVRCGQLHLSGNDALRDVAFLPELTGLTSFSLTECPRVSDLSALARSSAEYLILDEGSFGQADLTPVREMPKLRALLLIYEGGSHAPRLPPPHARVVHLTIETARPLDLSPIGDWPSLQGLQIILASAPALDLTPLAGLTDLEVTVSFKGDDPPPGLMGAELLGDRLTVERPETV
ncbi:NACHT domain-containing protein [Streptomyces hebeiensis]|uniref:NACHT domain-containing protein n=1 Tax=Streptomyces hebeiensis TaxID=229486 RepID=UPI0031D62071